VSIDENCAKPDGLRRFRYKTVISLNGIAFNEAEFNERDSS